MTTLYELSDEYAHLMAEIDAHEGEIAPELEAKLDAAGGSLVEKVDALCAIVRELDADAEVYGREAIFFAAKAKAASGRVAWLKAYLLRCLQAADLKDVRGAHFRAVRAKNPAAVVIDAGTKVPFEYEREKVEKVVDKVALKEALAKGAEIPGIRLEQKERIDIK
jgi:hypothetical protein